jgi:hypothetical protein
MPDPPSDSFDALLAGLRAALPGDADAAGVETALRDAYERARRGEPGPPPLHPTKPIKTPGFQLRPTGPPTTFLRVQRQGEEPIDISSRLPAEEREALLERLRREAPEVFEEAAETIEALRPHAAEPAAEAAFKSPIEEDPGLLRRLFRRR